MTAALEFARIDWGGRSIQLEYQWVGVDDSASPLLIFLHDGLGSLAMWKDFPQVLCARLGWRGLVYSRPGYGRSTARGADETWDVDFMHRQALEVLPALLEALGIDIRNDPPWLFGHSDGASIALLYAARYPGRVGALMLLAPHIMVEDVTIVNIELARKAYLETGLKQKLARFHDDPDSAFWGWCNIWLQEPFRQWSIEDEIASIRCPLLALQGIDDEYGTLHQIHRIAHLVEQSEVVELPDCRHSPHRDQPEQVIDVVCRFAAANKPGRAKIKEVDFG